MHEVNISTCALGKIVEHLYFSHGEWVHIVWNVSTAHRRMSFLKRFNILTTAIFALWNMLKIFAVFHYILAFRCSCVRFPALLRSESKDNSFFKHSLLS
jgi:hypothetical protein